MEHNDGVCVSHATKRWSRSRRVAMLGAGLLTSLLTCRCPRSFAAGDNLIPNSDFDTDLSGWTFPNGAFGLVWTSEDSSGHLNSGSLEIPNKWILDMASAESACVSVTGSSTYRFSTSARVTSDAGAGGLVAAWVAWYSDSNCESGLAFDEMRFSRPTWTKIARSVTAPTSAASARARVWVMKLSGPTDLFARAKFDAVSLTDLSTGDTTTTTSRSCAGDCGDPVTGATSSTTVASAQLGITATDARFILETAVGVQSCDPCVCDVDGDGIISAADALLELTAAVDPSVDLLCPP